MYAGFHAFGRKKMYGSALMQNLIYDTLHYVVLLDCNM